MAGVRASSIRQPAVAGLFYPQDSAACRAEAQGFLRPAAPQPGDPPRWLGAIVPHAGWICSGALAGEAIATLAQQGPVDVVVAFGAVHTPLDSQQAALDSHGQWALPSGLVQVPQDVQAQLAEVQELFAVDERFHRREHAVEVELPLIQLAWPAAAVLPIEVPLAPQAVQIGQRTAQVLSGTGLKVAYLASSDLTHYGPNYRFLPAGLGLQGFEWARENDRRLLQLVTDLAAERIVPEVQAHWNACGGGAIAALVAACRQLGARSARVLRHANSYETLAQVAPQPADNAVGYAAVVIG